MITEQALNFFWTLAIGAVLGIIFDFFRAVRYKRDIRNIIVYIQDIVFWLIVAVVIIISAFLINNGELRGYMFLGYLLGALLYILLLSKFIFKIMTILIGMINKVYQFFYTKISNFIKRMTNFGKIFEKKQKTSRI